MAYWFERVYGAIETGSVTEGNDGRDGCGQNPNTVVISTDNIGSGTYDRKNYCYFCKLPQTKQLRHMRLKHKNEDDVRDVTGEIDEALRNLGNHQHNRTVVKHGVTERILPCGTAI